MRFIRRVQGLGLIIAVLFSLFVPTVALAAGGLNDFTIQSFDADYYLTKDSTSRSQLKVKEKIVVVFPPYDVNHGIERSIPEKYDGHSVGLKIASIKDEKGKDHPYTTYGSNHNKVVRIGDPNRYAHGLQTYVIEYNLQDVTKNFKEHDEIYWDTNGTDWGQTFGSVTARLHMEDDIAKAFDGQTRCFEGSKGSTGSCTVQVVKKSNETVVTFRASRLLYAGENVTFVAGFAKNTFTGYQPTAWEKLFPKLVLLWLLLGLAVFVGVARVMYRAWSAYGRSPEGKGTIIPEYIPPKDLSVIASSAILKRKGSDITAQIIDLAVRHCIRIYETETKSGWFKKKRVYELELLRQPTRLHSEEKRLIGILFGDDATIGKRISLEGTLSKLYTKTEKLEKDVESQLLKSGYLADRSGERKKYYKLGGLLLVLGIVLLNPGVFVSGIMVFIVAATFHPLTDKGVASRDYLKGLEMYMKLAEAERLKVLQSPKGAVKTPVDANNTKRLVTLYEHLLPYAIIFGIEKEWAKTFSELYQKPPEWYSGEWSTFNAAVFVTSLNNFSVVSNNTFTSPANSSSSGFSGGGSSGGGGGGGGGGGW